MNLASEVYFSSQKCRQVGGEAGHPEVIFANGTDSALEKCDLRVSQSPFFFYNCVMSVCPSFQAARGHSPGRQKPCLFESACKIECYALYSAEVQFSDNMELGCLI